MGSGWHEWPLMIFTVFGQCVAGGFIVLALALLKAPFLVLLVLGVVWFAKSRRRGC